MSRQISALDAFTSPTYPFVLTPPSPHSFITISFSFPLLSLHTSLAYSRSLSFFTATVFSFLLSSPLYPRRETSCHFRWLHRRSFNFFRVTSILYPSLVSLAFLTLSLRISSLSFLIRAKRFGFSVSFSLSFRRRFLHQPEQTPALLYRPPIFAPIFRLIGGREGGPQQPTKSGASSLSGIGCSICEVNGLGSQR